jgi:hypothetical protein
MIVYVLHSGKRNTAFVIFLGKLSIRLRLSIKYKQQVVGTVRVSALGICDISISPTQVFRAAPKTESRILNDKRRFVEKTPKIIRNLI